MPKTKKTSSRRKSVPLAPVVPDLQNKFIGLAARLSPENLTCDGECTRTQVRARLRAIRAAWRALEAQAGRRVSESEVDEWWINSLHSAEARHAV